MTERWKDVVGYEGLYQVSSLGRAMRVGGGPGARVGRILKPWHDKYGYLVVDLWRDGRRKIMKVHRLIAVAFLGPAPSPGHEINHKNGDKTDPRPENLEWVTPSENRKHAFRVLGEKPRSVNGEAHGNAKLTDSKVRRIRKLYDTGKRTQAELGRMFVVHKATIGQIVRRETWKHVP